MSNRSSNIGNGNSGNQSLVQRNFLTEKEKNTVRFSPYQQVVKYAVENGLEVPVSSKGFDFDMKN